MRYFAFPFMCFSSYPLGTRMVQLSDLKSPWPSSKPPDRIFGISSQPWNSPSLNTARFRESSCVSNAPPGDLLSPRATYIEAPGHCFAVYFTSPTRVKGERIRYF
ncbi:hypothetical protein CDAR_198371 [Caerostris darwini]|uniref:Secreted protein n=1 Tax=Caerostris darwini TaxID=1538125 RepID=A0AAV4W4J4_9ARAC|nr:hypothetical protein CDAR_198371 [Caerostris darwini]